MADVITRSYLSDKPMKKFKQEIRDCADKVVEEQEKIARMGLATIRKTGKQPATILQLHFLKECGFVQVAREAEKLLDKFNSKA